MAHTLYLEIDSIAENLVFYTPICSCGRKGGIYINMSSIEKNRKLNLWYFNHIVEVFKSK